MRIGPLHHAPALAPAAMASGSPPEPSESVTLGRLFRPEIYRLQPVASGQDEIKHQCVIDSMAWSGDGLKLMTAQWEHELRLWDVTTGQAVAELQVEDPQRRRMVRASGVALSPDGLSAASGAQDGAVSLWRLSDGQELKRLRHTDPETPETVSKYYGWESVSNLAYAPAGQLLASGGYDHTVCLWDPQTGGLRHRLRDTDRNYGMAFSPDGSRLYTKPGNGLTIWNTQTGRQILHIADPDEDGGSGGNLALSRDGSKVAAIFGDGVHVWDAQTGEQLGCRKIRGGHRAAFTPEGDHLLVGETIHNVVHDWNLATGAVERLELPHAGDAGGINNMGFSPDGKRLAIGLLDYSLTLWERQSDQGLRSDEPRGTIRRIGDFVLVGQVRLPVRKSSSRGG
ncbi:MAG: PQQ-binding-like beta-propeller repeat protein [Armatimonadetes bacterium]|nr:PQQ-binding-like beta-propeller repeat protein [Armatimonadota bacterium]